LIYGSKGWGFESLRARQQLRGPPQAIHTITTEPLTATLTATRGLGDTVTATDPAICPSWCDDCQTGEHWRQHFGGRRLVPILGSLLVGPFTTIEAGLFSLESDEHTATIYLSDLRYEAGRPEPLPLTPAQARHLAVELIALAELGEQATSPV